MLRSIVKRKLFFCIVFPVVMALGQQQQILLDEDFSDWQGVPLAHADAAGDPGQGVIDLLDLKLSNDENHFFLQATLLSPLSLNNDNSLVLYLDIDGDNGTGLSVHGMGAEIEWRFGERAGRFHGNSGVAEITHVDLGLVSAPTVRSAIFELAVSRHLTIAGTQVAFADNIHVMLSDGASGDRLPDAEGGVEYTMLSGPFLPLPEVSLDKAATADFRMLTYNIERDGLLKDEKAEYFSRILRFLSPDIIAFQELVNSTEAEVKSTVETMTGRAWHASKIGYDLVLLSQFPITHSDSIRTYETSSFTKIHAAHLLNLRPHVDSDLLILNSHPKAGSGSYEDDKRREEFDMILAWLRELKAGNGPYVINGGTPILWVGDMNLVGDPRQQTAMLTGDIVDNGTVLGDDFHPDWDNSDFEDVRPMTYGRPMTFTHYNPWSTYSPGRLDYMVYTGSVLEAVNAFVCFTRALPEAVLSEGAIQADDAVNASDHLPVVADFRLTQTATPVSSNRSVKPTRFVLHNYPNPFNPETTVLAEVAIAGDYQLSLFNVKGGKIRDLNAGHYLPGLYRFSFEAGDLASGVYLLCMQGETARAVQKIVLNR